MFYKPGESHNLPRDPFKACVIVSNYGKLDDIQLAKRSAIATTDRVDFQRFEGQCSQSRPLFPVHKFDL